MKRLQLKSLGAEVEAALKEEIMSGRLRSGDLVSIANLSRQFGTSVTPVRDAIHRLSAIGFVKVSPRKEVRVASLDAKKLQNVFEIRMALEGLAIHAATAKISDLESERAWQTLCEAEAKYSATGNAEDLLAQDGLVHDLIIQNCDNDMLIMLMQGFRDLSRWAQRTVIRYQPQAVAKALPEHKEILAAMRTHSAAAAEKALISHLSNTLERALPHLAAAPANEANSDELKISAAK
jgi:DNA-binding GntR family transcriptional regulator